MKVINWIYNHNTKKCMTISLILIVIGMILIFSQYFGLVTLADDKALDMLFIYDQGKFYEVLHLLTESDRLAYKLIHIADYVFILGFYSFISYGLSKVIKIDSKLCLIVLLPFISGLFDMLENIMMDIHLYLYPTEIMVLGSVAGVFTMFKFSLLYLSIILYILFGVLKIIQKR